MIPYFSTIDTPAELIVFVLLATLSGWICMLFLTIVNLITNNLPYKFPYLQYTLTFIIGEIIFIFLSWIFIGDSTPWSEAISKWLMKLNS